MYLPGRRGETLANVNQIPVSFTPQTCCLSLYEETLNPHAHTKKAHLCSRSLYHQSFGELALMAGMKRSADCVTPEDTGDASMNTMCQDCCTPRHLLHLYFAF